MVKRKKKHSIPELNTTSTADISFMLLIFFLLTTSMDSDKGLGRMLPPKEPDKQEELQDVDRNKVLVLHVMKNGKITINDEETIISPEIRKTIKQFIVNVGESHIIEIQVNRSADYDSYFKLQNQIVKCYKELGNYPQRIQEIVVDE